MLLCVCVRCSHSFVRLTESKESAGVVAAGAERGEEQSGAAWETLVLFAVNFTKLNVHMNMGNVMGNVRYGRGHGRVSLYDEHFAS